MKWLEKGTPAFGLLCGLVGAVVALLLLFIGFWPTVVVALFFAVGYFFGAVKDKTEAVKKGINRLFPPKDE